MNLARKAGPTVALFLASLLSMAPGAPDEPTQTEPALPDVDLSALPPYEGVPDEYLDGRGYLGHFSDAWDTAQLLDPFGAKTFLALQDGASRESLAELDVPDLDLVLKDLRAGRMVRESGGILRPAFPVIRGEAREQFRQTVEFAAARVYRTLKPSLKKFRKLAAKENVAPQLHTLLWSEVLESRAAEETLVLAGALDGTRLRQEGYLWLLIPNDPYATGVDRYSSGLSTLTQVWSGAANPIPLYQDIDMEQHLLDRAEDRRPWDSADTESVSALGLLTEEKLVRVPALRNASRLLIAMRKASPKYARAVLAVLQLEPLQRRMAASHDEVFAPLFVSVGYRILERAERDGFIARPLFPVKPEGPPEGLDRSLAVVQEETPDHLERAYFLYDRREYEAAASESDLFLAGHPGDAEGLFRKGMSLMKLRKYQEALETFDRALAAPAPPMDVWRGWILIRSGNLLDLLNRREEAERRYQLALDSSIVANSHEAARDGLEQPYRE